MQEILERVATEIETKLSHLYEVQHSIKRIEQHIEVVQDRAERLQPRLKEGEKNDYLIQKRELENDLFYEKLAERHINEEITELKGQLYTLIVIKETGKHPHAG